MKSTESAKQYNNIVRNFTDNSALFGIMTLPAGDGNYESHLKAATLEDLSTALTVMNAFPDGNRSRIAVCQRRFNEMMA